MIRDEMALTRKNQVIVELGVYEKWTAGLNTCSSSGLEKGDARFTFDIRNIATAKRFLDDSTDAPMQWLRGDSMDRKMIVSGTQNRLEIGLEHGRFESVSGRGAEKALVQRKGVFFTDSYFRKVVDGPGRFNLKQFVKPGFKTVMMEAGSYTPTSPWGGFYNTEKMGRGRFLNIENAVRKEVD